MSRFGKVAGAANAGAASLWGRNIQLAIRPNATDKQMLSWIRAMVPVAILVAALIALLAQTIYWLICMAYALTLVVLFVLRCSRAVSLAALALIFSLFAVMVSLAINCLIG